MIREIKTFTTNNCLPSIDDIKDAVRIANANNCKVILKYITPHGANEELTINHDSDFATVWANRPLSFRRDS